MSVEGELTCHLLAYFVDLKAPGFQDRLLQLRQRRLERIKVMTQKMNALGLAVDVERVIALAAGGSVGRPHLADALVEKGYVKN